TIDSLLTDLCIPKSLRELGVAEADLPAIAAASMGNSMRGNPVEMTPDSVLPVLETFW
ncbi:MAG: iron-containing alcohol dehydrogenase, partial [Planctomycetaceae bacterium]|nr:iron-containing alcohol dehydrogenase [Planctomycetaceae bacterium]